MSSSRGLGRHRRRARCLDGADAFAHFYRLVAKGLRDVANRDDDTEWENTARVLSVFPDAGGK